MCRDGTVRSFSEAVRAKKAGLSGTGVNGAFTHPSIIVNAVYATLREAGAPLSESQEEQLHGIGDRYVQEETRRVASYDDDVLALRQVIEEAALKDRLYAEIDAMLSGEQRDVLHPEGTRGRTAADLFSSGLVWLQVAQPMGFNSRDELAKKLTNVLRAQEQIPEAEEATLSRIVTEWVAGLDDAFLSVRPARGHAAKYMPVAHVTAAARHQLVLRQRLLASIGDEGARKRIREQAFVRVPFSTVSD